MFNFFSGHILSPDQDTSKCTEFKMYLTNHIFKTDPNFLNNVISKVDRSVWSLVDDNSFIFLRMLRRSIMPTGQWFTAS